MPTSGSERSHTSASAVINPTNRAKIQPPATTIPSATGISASAESSRRRGAEATSGTRCPVATFASLELDDRPLEVPATERGPMDREKDQLGIGELPQHEVAEPLLAAGSDQELGIGQTERVQGLAEQLLIDLRTVQFARRDLLGQAAG